MTANDVPRPRDDVMFRELEDGCVLYDPANEKLHSLNITAGAIWCLINGSRSLADIADEVSFMTKADRAVVLDDVIRAAGQFARLGLIEC